MHRFAHARPDCLRVFASAQTVGTGSLGWMLLLAAVMAIEKNVRWGRRLSPPLGVAVLAWAAVLVVTHA